MHYACCSWSHGLRPKKKKKLSVSVAVPLAPIRVPSQSPLAPSVASVMSVANDKGDNSRGHIMLEYILESENKSGSGHVYLWESTT